MIRSSNQTLFSIGNINFVVNCNWSKLHNHNECIPCDLHLCGSYEVQLTNQCRPMTREASSRGSTFLRVCWKRLKGWILRHCSNSECVALLCGWGSAIILWALPLPFGSFWAVATGQPFHAGSRVFLVTKFCSTKMQGEIERYYALYPIWIQ